jgi:hypothetical protein
VSGAVAFKEWSWVCRALLSGRQTLMLRKGGIAEGRSGFSFKHSAFFLMPTRFHEQEKHLKPEDQPGPAAQEAWETPPEGQVLFPAFARLEETFVLEDWGRVEALDPFHVWTGQTVRERFEYEAPGAGTTGCVSVALVRVFRVTPAWSLADSPKFGGCRSWIDLPEPPAQTLKPVLTDEAFEDLAGKIRKVVR